MAYFVLDIETVPVDKGAYLDAENDQERKKLLNPIDSKIIAIGLKKNGQKAVLLQGENEKEMIQKFWRELKGFRKGGSDKLIGFNIKEFDLPFLVTRSFILDVEIVPFVLKDVVDLREKVSAYKYGKTRGKLKEYADFLNIEKTGMEGEDVAEEYWAGNIKKILEYLEKDLEITEAMYERIVRLKIDLIDRW